ncbi:MAG: bifunctional nuclease family protein [Candidatus Microthrix subdominans]|mgnify:FL=1|uniref:Bifunctional nuclease family protein n=1 Tax=Candidatus Neomicrothrix subdominans TaxID=2954438 RepID=A0A936TFR2_9ACTN|nr:bifunctional nuclease family protein [Candidatus Microthrix sp.]MBK9298347.1 bifunctional nuclease family protein [Candidatus Microthrix subdominans]MBK6309856.1 bifunctional nuclease family protein [Candidatus Microthrix sp.]MBK6438832.1 bifunctional nuclease family protein [Candidatus Microthrix sp.]MBK6968247.1 bifunctional nuclease family protein [Candidatus Microthrix sp.]MBK7166102.1 bifunctional nuclease family protein [Candidatus Microthrix sp.]
MSESTVQMELVGVRRENPGDAFVVDLRETDSPRRMLTIFIGVGEWQAIRFALEGRATPRPLTHDLMQSVIESLGATLDTVVITDLRDEVYYAELRLSSDDSTITVESRTSDALAMAARVDADVMVATSVLEAAGYRDNDDEQPESVIAEFREFIDTVTPDDFEES